MHCVFNNLQNIFTHVTLSHAGGKARQDQLGSHPDVLGAGPAEAKPWQDPQPGGRRPGEIFQVEKQNPF